MTRKKPGPKPIMIDGINIKEMAKRKKCSESAVYAAYKKGADMDSYVFRKPQMYSILGLTIKEYAKQNNLSEWKIYRTVHKEDRQQTVIDNPSIFSRGYSK